MRTVYADLVFAANFALDYILLYMCLSFLHLKIKFSRIVVASLIGGLTAVLVAIAGFMGLLRIPLGFLISSLMLYICLGKQSLRLFLTSMAALYMFSLILCGVAVMICSGILKNCGIVTLTFSVAILLFFNRLLGRSIRGVACKRIVESRIEVAGTGLTVRLMSDSGNVLVDPYTNLPVIILKKEVQLKCNNELTRIVPFGTASGSGILRVFTPQKIEIVQEGRYIEIKASVGICDNENVTFCGYDGLIPESLCKHI